MAIYVLKLAAIFDSRLTAMKSCPLKLLFFFLLAAFSARAEILTVGQNERFQAVNAAISSAKTGDTIQVKNGTYTENLVVDKTLTIEGIEKPTIKGTGKGSVVEIRADNCAVLGFRIETSGGDLQAEDAGILLKSNGNTIEDNELSDILFGIYLLHSADNKIRRNRIAGRAELESGERGGGFHLWNSERNLLEDNVVTEARDGIYVQNSPHNLFRRNRVSNLRYGLHFMSSDDNRFEENVFYDNIAGAAIMYSQRITLRRNLFIHNRGFSSFGILYQDCRECVTEENLIFNNATGIFLEGVKNSVFRRNTIAENDAALQIFSSSDLIAFTQNNFVGNISPLRMVGARTNAKWQTDAGGNYWSDYDGYDLDGDGVGDVPHKIQNVFEYLEGNFPRLRIYLNSPAAQSVVLAEKSFPILQQTKEFDQKPLMRSVKIDFPFQPQGESGKAKWTTLAVSVLMLGFSVLTFRRLNYGFGK